MAPTPAALCDNLQTLLESADLDKALNLLEQIEVRVLLQRAGSLRSRLACMIADILDYGGRYESAREVVQQVGRQAQIRLAGYLREPSSNRRLLSKTETEAEERKQEAWAVIQLGMSLYRTSEDHYLEALLCFEQSRDALMSIEASGQTEAHKCNASLARAWYCIGLVHRQTARGFQAREAFSRCIEYGWKGTEERVKAGKSPASFDYQIGRCFGLGTAWTLYNEASLTSAQNNVVAARRLLLEVDPRKEKVRFIHAYVEIIHAGVIMSAHSEAQRLDEAIHILTETYETLGGDAALTRPTHGHGAYALRALTELARGHLRRALAAPIDQPTNRKDHLNTALGLARKVQASPAARKDRRTRCNAFIIESRLHRANGKDAEALQAAETAMKIGAVGEFSRIDCWITLGEAKYWTDDYPGAVSAFLRALEFGKSNPKVFAACHLHLANSYFKLDNRPKALDYFNTWKVTQRGLENASIRDLVESVHAKMGEFSITADRINDEITSGKNNIIKDYTSALEKWVADVVVSKVEGENPGLSEAQKRKRAAKLLDIDEKTVLKYQRYRDSATTGNVEEEG